MKNAGLLGTCVALAIVTASALVTVAFRRQQSMMMRVIPRIGKQ